MGRRILVLGSTGVGKAVALQQLSNYRERLAGVPVKFFDFEKDFVEAERPLYQYLDVDEVAQRRIWQAAWVRFLEEFGALGDTDVILAMHGVVVRKMYGFRTPIIIDDIKRFSPSLIITLIDDVYLQWARTERRAHGEDHIGRPTLAQLLAARRAEIFLADIIAAHVNPPTLNYALAVHHPARTLDRLIFGAATRRKTIYLSFPISGPRRDQGEGDSSGIDGINAFLAAASEFDRASPPAVCFCPLTIDELPLAAECDATADNADEVAFNVRAKRWDVRQFYGSDPLLTVPESHPVEVRIPRQDCEDAVGLIKTDVAVRDYRLVSQASCLVVLNPWYKGNATGGVRNEIRAAMLAMKPVYVYQDPAHDPNGQAVAQLKGSRGSLGDIPRAEYIHFHRSIPALFDAVKSWVDKKR